GTLRITTPEQEGTFALPYHVSDQRGGTSTGIITVHVSADAELQPPVAVDDLVRTITILDQERVSIPVLDNDFDPDGTRDRLTVDLVDAPEGAAVVDRQVQVDVQPRSEEHTSELQSRENLVCRLLLEKKKRDNTIHVK